MAINYIFSGQSPTSSEDNDFLAGIKATTGTSDNAIQGSNDDDLVIANSRPNWGISKDEDYGTSSAPERLSAVLATSCGE